MFDIHCHVLPGVDDGARDFEDSLRILKWLERQGVRGAIATPHYINETEYTSTRKNNVKLVKELRVRAEEAGIKVKIFLGNEIYIDENIAELIEAGKISTMAGSRYILVELPLNGEFSNYEDYLIELTEKGFKVILAHPERYAIVQEDFEIARNLKAKGILLQCNLMSLLGRYGKEAEKTVRRLAREKMVFTFASDTHRAGRAEYLTKARKKMKRYYDEREITRLLMTNPQKILVKE